jgi:ERCC4-type nuclease
MYSDEQLDLIQQLDDELHKAISNGHLHSIDTSNDTVRGDTHMVYEIRNPSPKLSNRIKRYINDTYHKVAMADPLSNHNRLVIVVNSSLLLEYSTCRPRITI